MRRLSLASLLLAALTPASALAINQPDGTPIPQGNGLQGLFNSRGEAINALTDAQTTPETFVPGCALTFTVLQRNAGYQNAFGWYNVTGQAPTLADLHEFLACSDGINTTKVLDIKNDPNYLGGEVGFYQGVVTSGCAPGQGKAGYAYVFYSQKQYNPDSNQANPFIHLLIYNSTVTPKAFYFGWEDLISGGDNDFDDLTTFVTGITCSGGGEPCDTGQPGVCAAGTLQCQVGQLACVPTSKPAPEKCDGLDNDCNGFTDEGDNLCPADQICDRGVCVPRCVKDGCEGNLLCNNDGYCVDPACESVVCEQGKVCLEGSCVGPCDGVVCPKGQVCRVGACVDPCDGLSCDENQVCTQGVCVDNCQCGGCKAGETCLPGGQCVSDFCATNSCEPGTVCIGNACVDPCDGAVCPKGQVCQGGACIPDPNPGTGGAAGAGGDAGTGGDAGSGGSPAGSGGSDAGSGGAAGTGGSGGQGGAVAGSGGSDAGTGGGGTGGGGAAAGTGGGGTGGGGGQAGTGGGGTGGGGAAAGTGGGGTGGGGGKGGSSGAGASNGTNIEDSGDDGGCGCAVPGRSERGGWALAALGLALAARRRRREE
jgi:MYXO-CTERM domain-containing protein